MAATAAVAATIRTRSRNTMTYVHIVYGFPLVGGATLTHVFVVTDPGCVSVQRALWTCARVQGHVARSLSRRLYAGLHRRQSHVAAAHGFYPTRTPKAVRTERLSHL